MGWNFLNKGEGTGSVCVCVNWRNRMVLTYILGHIGAAGKEEEFEDCGLSSGALSIKCCVS